MFIQVRKIIAIIVIFAAAACLPISAADIDEPDDYPIIFEEYIDTLASHYAPITGGVVIGGYAYDGAAQSFEISLSGTISTIEAYITNYPPGSGSSEFKWILKNAENIDSLNIDSLPVLISGNARSVSSNNPYNAPPAILTSNANIHVEPGRRLLLQVCEGHTTIVWNGGVGALPGDEYLNRNGVWELMWNTDWAEFGRRIWVWDKASIDDKHNHIPDGFHLSQNYPNPFNPTTTISFTLTHPQHTTLKVYDLLGREILVLVDEHKQAGQYTVAFDASDLASGFYFYRLQAGDYTESRRMVLLK